MTTKTLRWLAFAAALAIAVPAAATAQSGSETPEGTSWHLSSYASDSGMEAVPWLVDASLDLEGGTASGSGGCNTFSGSYTLAGDALAFDEAFAVTRTACPDPQASVEAAYLPLLPETASWSVSEDVLTLRDPEGEPLLVYELPVIALTASDLAAIATQLEGQQAAIDRADARIDSIRVGTLRDRIKELEAAVAALRAQVAARSSSSKTGSAGATFDASEKVLTRRIPPKIRTTCTPLRGSNLPAGTVAAVRCQPKSNVVNEMAYYLMEYRDATRTLRSVAQANGVSKGGDCLNGRAGYSTDLPFTRIQGCWVDGGQAQVRVADTASSCRQLDVDGKRLRNPVVYAAIEGSAGRIKPLFSWAYAPGDFLDWSYSVMRPVEPAGMPDAPLCDDGL